MSTHCACCRPRDDVAWVPYGNHLWVRMAEYDRLRTALETIANNVGEQFDARLVRHIAVQALLLDAARQGAMSE